MNAQLEHKLHILEHDLGLIRHALQAAKTPEEQAFHSNRQKCCEAEILELRVALEQKRKAA